MNRLFAFVLLVLACLAATPLVSAQSSSPAADGSPSPLPEDDSAEALAPTPPPVSREDADTPIRFEVTLGFVGGYARYADLGFGSPIPQGALASGAATGLGMSGVRYDLRLVVSFVRMTVGADFTWGFLDPTNARTVDDGGTVRTVSDQRIFDGGLRFGLGLEANLDRVRLFADVIGTVHFVEAQIRLDTTSVTQVATGFSPGLRVGARVAIAEAFFAQIAVDGSPFGPTWVGGDLSVGFAIE